MTTPTNFVERLVLALIPHFMHVADSAADARTEILATLASYNPRSRAEFLHAAQIIAFSLTALDVLVDAEAPEMSQSMRLRTCATANALHRSAHRVEVTLQKRLACDSPHDAKLPHHPVDDMSDEQIDEMLEVIQQPVETLNRLKPGTNPYKPAKPSRSEAALAHLFAAMPPLGDLAATG